MAFQCLALDQQNNIMTVLEILKLFFPLSSKLFPMIILNPTRESLYFVPRFYSIFGARGGSLGKMLTPVAPPPPLFSYAALP